MRSSEHSRDSWIISVTDSILSNLILLYFFWMRPESVTIARAMGIGHTIDSPMTGDHTRTIMPITGVNISEDMTEGSQCESMDSCMAMSPITLTLRSVGSFLEK